MMFFLQFFFNLKINLCLRRIILILAPFRPLYDATLVRSLSHLVYTALKRIEARWPMDT